ncbi:ABC transporter permease [Pararoseomonas indoligenes]|uniref:ABC transporter permease n=1 Tax=Roseomonas indoligenes TaxID=2820811 RepID=A0A940N1V5_9PROT|nr:ABC transporter permease [Pararoseomonas indoligenes]MBP0495024.1 ABC transporter permease [Pararoseomonas indoligenes]
MPIRTQGALLLLLPSLLLLAALFLIPIAWFLFGSMQEFATWSELVEEAEAVLFSGGVGRSLVNTGWIGAVVTLLALVIGYPMSYVLSRARGLAFTAILLCIVLPYFTSTIVRTYAWMVLLGRNGLINQILLGLGIVEEPLQLLYNRLGVVIGMTYVLLPYMVLTLYAAMKAVDHRLLQAAEGMGATPAQVFRRVFVPLTMHGVVAGVLITFILAIGFFVTPALMGGPSDVMIAMLIEREVEITQNWPAAAMMTVVLLAVTLTLYAVYSRFAEPGEAAR